MTGTPNVPLIEDRGSNKGKKWMIAGLILLALVSFLGALVYALVGIANNEEKVEKHEKQIAVLEHGDSLSDGKIKALEKTTKALAFEVERGKAEDARLDGEIKKAVAGHEKRLHKHKGGSKSGQKNHDAPAQSNPKSTKEEAEALVANALKSCADRGGELVMENGKAKCETKVVQEPVQVTPPKVAQLETSKVGTPCPGGGRSGTYQIINGQLACLLDGVVRVTESYQRPEPEVVYAEPRRIVRDELPSSQDEGDYYYEEDRGSSAWPWVIGAGALAWALNRHNTSAPATAVATGRPAVTTNPVGLGVVTGPAW